MKEGEVDKSKNAPTNTKGEVTLLSVGSRTLGHGIEGRMDNLTF